jgi:hypothetical protein
MPKLALLFRSISRATHLRICESAGLVASTRLGPSCVCCGHLYRCCRGPREFQQGGLQEAIFISKCAHCLGGASVALGDADILTVASCNRSLVPAISACPCAGTTRSSGNKVTILQATQLSIPQTSLANRSSASGSLAGQRWGQTRQASMAR